MRRSVVVGVRAWAWSAAIIVPLLSACAAKQAAPPGTEIRILAVYPIERVVHESATDAGSEHPAMPEEAGVAVTGEVYRALAHQSAFRFVPDLTATDAAARPAVRAASSLAEKARALGREVGADGVIFGRVLRFRERVGTEYGATSPAAVSIDLSLVRVSDGELLWQDSFDEVQESLSANLLDFWMFWEGGPRWFSVRELAGMGVDEMLDDMHDAVR